MTDLSDTPASAAKGKTVDAKPLAWRFRYPGDGRWHYSVIEPIAYATDAEPLYLQPHPSEQTPASAAKGKAWVFGPGRLVVDTGTYHGQPAVFVYPVASPGPVGESSAHLGHDRYSLQQGEQVLTFPTAAQAVRVADALVNAQPHPSQRAGTEAAFREGYAVGYCDGQAHDPTNDVDASCAAYLASPATGWPSREDVARVVDPEAFIAWEGFPIGQKDAFAKADQILALIAEGGEAK